MFLQKRQLLFTIFSLFFINVSALAEQNQTTTTHVAFAGGGWRAHTGHTAWTMALLNQSDQKLANAYRNVDTFSSNSGGSWFTAMMLYSEDFVDALEAPDALQQWSKPTTNPKEGWLGQQHYLFANAGCGALGGAVYVLCVFNHYAGGVDGATYWHRVIDKLVFANHQTKARLDSPRVIWGQDKEWLLAGSLLTSQAVLGRDGIDEQYYQACLSPAAPVLNGSQGALCKPEATPEPVVSPVSFSSLPKDSKMRPLPFLRAASTDKVFNLGYSERALWRPSKEYSTIKNPIETKHLPVIVAASASSAATGFAASKSVSESWVESFVAADEALNFRVQGGLTHIIANGLNTQQLAKQQVIQIADGGAVDNTAVTQLVAYLQLNKQADDFNVVVFDNVQNLYVPKSGASVGTDIANLFGKSLWNGNQVCAGAKGEKPCVTVPKLQVFAANALETTPVTWLAKTGNSDTKINEKIIYTKYEVETVDNPEFGITAGKKGTLHAFTAAWSTAKTAPQNTKKDGDFDAYTEMMEFINSGLKQSYNGQTGEAHLKKAFGL